MSHQHCMAEDNDICIQTTELYYHNMPAISGRGEGCRKEEQLIAWGCFITSSLPFPTEHRDS